MIDYLKTYLCTLVLFNIVFSINVKGTVKDIDTNEPLIGANVFIEGTSKGSATDANGAYFISDIRACSTCEYKLKVLYIGYEQFEEKFTAYTQDNIIKDLKIKATTLEAATTTVTAKKRQDKVVDAPAAIELVSASDIKKEESTNIGAYLKGIKGVDFTSSGVNQFSISVRGFNSSFASRLLTLTDGRIANIPALRVVNYSTIPQSSKDIESIEVALGPSTALYGANAHSGVVNITSKSPAKSQGLDISVSGSINDDINLYKVSSRWASEINNKLSFKLSNEYLQAYEWEFISEQEYKRHIYPFTGNPIRETDGKDNNPWGATGLGQGITAAQYAAADIPSQNVNTMIGYYLNTHPGIDGIENTDDDVIFTFRTEEECFDAPGYVCTPVSKIIGDGESNQDTGDPDGDGFMGEDWYNGYDDDGDGLIDEDYFFADGIDNDGDCPGDTNGDGVICGWGDENVDEDIDWQNDTWIDGYDNNGNGVIDEEAERYDNDPGKFNLPEWGYNMEFKDIIITKLKHQKYINGEYNVWYDSTIAVNDISLGKADLRGSHYYDEDLRKMIFDVFIYDFGEDGLPGDNAWIDLFGDGVLNPHEGNNFMDISGTSTNVPFESCLENSASSNGLCSDEAVIYTNPTLIIRDCGLDGLCEGDYGWTSADIGEGNGIWDVFDYNYGLTTASECSNVYQGVYYPSFGLCGDGVADQGDAWSDNDDNGFFTYNSDDSISDTYPYANNQYDEGEIILDYGQDGIAGTNDLGENDGLLIFQDENELDGINDTGDNCFGCGGDDFDDLDNDGIYNPSVDDFRPEEHDINGDGVYTPPDYQDSFTIVNDLDGDGYDDFPDFEVKNSKGEFRLDYDPNPNINLTFQTGYSWSKTQQVTGIGRYIADGYQYTYYQLRGRYKNWFSQVYLNQGNSGDTRGYDLGNRITDTSQNMAFQLQNNFNFKNTKFVWGVDYFRTEANTNGSVLNDGPNGYDNDGDQWITSNDNIDNDMDSDDFSDWGIDGIGPFLTENNSLVVDDCDECEPRVSETVPGATYDETFDLYFIDNDGDGIWTTNNPYYPFIANPNYTGPDFGEGNGIPDGGEIIIHDVNVGDAVWNDSTGMWTFGATIFNQDANSDIFVPYYYDSNESYWYTLADSVNTGDAIYNANNNNFMFNESFSIGFDNIYGTQDDFWYNIMPVNTGDATYNSNSNQWEFGYQYFNNNFIDTQTGEIINNVDIGDFSFNNQTNSWYIEDYIFDSNENYWYDEIESQIDTGDGIFDLESDTWIYPLYNSENNEWYNLVSANVGDATYDDTSNEWTFDYAYDNSSQFWWEDIDNDYQYDPGEPGVNLNGFVYEDGLDNDCDGCDFDNDGIPNFQESQLGFNIYDPTDYPLNSTLSGPIDALPSDWAYDEMIDEIWCGDIQYSPFVPQHQFTGQKNGRLWECGENFDEEDEYQNVTSNEVGFYFQTKTIPNRNDKWEIITAARFDHHDQLDEDIQFSPKFGLFYKPNPFATFRLTYGKAYNTPSAINLYTDIFMGRRGVVEYYLRGNREGTPYTRVGDEFITSIPQIATYETNTEVINEVELCNADNNGDCTNANWDMNGNSTLELENYTLNTFHDDTFILHNLGGQVSDFPNYWEGLVEQDWYENNDLNNNGIADLNEIDCSNPSVTVCPYQKRVQGAPYFLGFNTEFSNVPEFMPLDTALYTVWVPELADTGRIYTPLESLTIPDVDPIKTEKIQTIELGFKGFLSERIHVTTDYYMSRYEDFFSSPTVITPLIIERVFEYDENGNKIDVTSFDNFGGIVGMLTVNANLSNPPYATQWDGRDNDNDWHTNTSELNRFPYLATGGDIVECPNGESPCYADWYDVFRWDGIEENYTDYNENGMYDPGEFDVNDDIDGNGYWNCVDCAGEWGWILWETNTSSSGIIDTLGYNIKFPRSVVQNGEYIVNNQEAEGEAVGIDEYDPATGISEAELIDSPEISALGTVVQKPAYAYTPLHSILAPMNYGEVYMQGLDLGFTYLMPEQKMTFDFNFSFYGTTDYYNALTKKNDPINAPKFKMNASFGWESPIGGIAVKYRHVDRFEWSDGIWSGFIGPYDLFDLHYNYKINDYIEFNLTALNIFNDVHKELIGGAKMGRQFIMRLSTAL